MWRHLQPGLDSSAGLVARFGRLRPTARGVVWVAVPLGRRGPAESVGRFGGRWFSRVTVPERLRSARMRPWLRAARQGWRPAVVGVSGGARLQWVVRNVTVGGRRGRRQWVGGCVGSARRDSRRPAVIGVNGGLFGGQHGCVLRGLRRCDSLPHPSTLPRRSWWLQWCAAVGAASALRVRACRSRRCREAVSGWQGFSPLVFFPSAVPADRLCPRPSSSRCVWKDSFERCPRCAKSLTRPSDGKQRGKTWRRCLFSQGNEFAHL